PSRAAREARDAEKEQQAAEKFSPLVQMNGPQTDAALYWKAYAENRQGKRDTALATIAELKRRYPQSRWKRDGEALEIEVRNRSSHPVKIGEVENDDDLFSLAFQGLMNNDPAAGIKKAEEILNGSASPKRKSKVL